MFYFAFSRHWDEDFCVKFKILVKLFFALKSRQAASYSHVVEVVFPKLSQRNVCGGESWT